MGTQVTYKPVGAEARPKWGYEDIPPHEAVQVHYQQSMSPTPKVELAVDIDDMFVWLKGVYFSGVRAVRAPDDGQIVLELDATTGRGDRVSLRMNDHLAKQIVQALSRVAS
jgi:hypothetical protein